MLTKEEQEQYAEENIKLIHFFANKWRGPDRNYEDLVGAATIGYVDAIKKFDPQRGIKFSTFAGVAINSALSKYWRKEKNRIKPISLEAIVNNGDTKTTTILDMIPSPEIDETIKDVQEVLNEVIRYMPKQKVQAMKMYLEGKTQTEIGEVLGVSQVQASRIIREVMQMVKEEYWNHEKAALSKNPKKAVMNMRISQEEYNDYKAQGKKDKEIADIKGMTVAGLSYYKKKWTKEEVKPRTPRLILEKGESVPTVHEDLVHDLSKKLKKAEKQNDLLEKKVAELEEQTKNLHAAAEDTEKEVAASQEYIEREQELMTDANVWKQQALQYKAENERLNNDNRELREENSRFKGESALFRATLKAVL